MANSASHATNPSESDFHDSHPLEEENSSPSLSDLSDLDSLPDDTPEKEIGDLSTMENAGEDDVLGDITLLEEAFAEMGDEESVDSQDSDLTKELSSIDELSEVSGTATSQPVNNQNSDISAEQLPDLDSLAADMDNDNDSNIPVLDDVVSQMTSELSPQPEVDQSDDGIPVLEETPTVFSNEDSETDSTLEHLLDQDSAASTATGKESSVFVDAKEDVLSNPEQFASDVSGFAEIDADETITTSVDEFSHLDIANVSDEVISETVDDKIAQLTADPDQTEINELPAMDPISGITTEFAESMSSVPLSSLVTQFDEEQTEQPSHTAHQVSMGKNTSFSMDIPFELHAQLSRKINDLVIDATTSLTNELNEQLYSKLSELLEKSVEAILPTLANQLVSNMRGEIKQRITEQLPSIINDVLGKTTLKE